MEKINTTQYDEYVGKIKTLVNCYDEVLSSNRYFFGLANGDNFNLSFPKNNIAHLLGVSVDKLKTIGLIKSNVSSYDALKKIANQDITYYGIRKFNLEPSEIFSDYLENKLEIFNDNIRVRTDDIYAIIKYSTDRSYTTSEEKEICDYFIIRKNEKGYMVLGIAKGDNLNGDYVPVTSRLFKTYLELKESFLNKVAKNQEVTYPATFRIDNASKDYFHKVNASYDARQAYIRNLRDMADKYNSIPSVVRDFSITLNVASNNKQKSYNKSSILGLITEGVKGGSIIDKEEVIEILDDTEIPSELDTLIDVCNDLICHKSVNSELISDSYSSIQSENSSLKSLLEDLKAEVLEQKSINEQLKAQLVELRETSNENAEDLQILKEAYQKVLDKPKSR